MLSDFRNAPRLPQDSRELDARPRMGVWSAAIIEMLVDSHGAAYGFEPGSPEYEDLARKTLASGPAPGGSTPTADGR